MDTKPTILVVEDSADDFDLFRRAWGKASSCELLWLQDGDDAVKKLSDESIAKRLALIVCDLKMPKADGFEVLRFAKSKVLLRNIPFVIFTASNEPTDRERARKLGADMYLVKPSRFTDLVEITKRLEDWAQSMGGKSPRVQMESFDWALEHFTLTNLADTLFSSNKRLRDRQTQLFHGFLKNVLRRNQRPVSWVLERLEWLEMRIERLKRRTCWGNCG